MRKTGNACVYRHRGLSGVAWVPQHGHLRVGCGSRKAFPPTHLPNHTKIILHSHSLKIHLPLHLPKDSGQVGCPETPNDKRDIL